MTEMFRAVGRREPVMAAGLLSAVLIFLAAVGVPVPADAETTLLSGLAAIGSLLALWKVRQPGPPTVVVGGIASALFVALAAAGWPLPEELITAIQTAIPVIVGWVVRKQVTPEVAADGTTG